MINSLVLRSQSQAQYSPDNIGHFGLALQRYAHFTSPIRRYADLLVHRALVGAYDFGDGALDKAQGGEFTEIGAHISATERRAAAAEREAVDRYTAAYLSDRVGEIFGGRVTGVARFGLFVMLDDSGADGIVPISTLPNDFYDHDERSHALVGRRWGRVYQLGDRVSVRLVAATPLTGGITLDLIEGGSEAGDRPSTGPKVPGKRPPSGRAPHGHPQGRPKNVHPGRAKAKGRKRRG
jgi:ribonuclease R